MARGNKNQIVKKKRKDYEIFSKNKINILFTGNIGDAQNFGLIIELVKATQKEINWIIAGKGRRFDFLEEVKLKENLKNFKLLGLLKFAELQKYVEHADALLITLKPGDAFDATIPGKFQTYLSYRKRIIGLIGGEVFDIINKYEIGYASKLKDVNQIKINLMNYLSKQQDLKKFNKNIDILSKIYSKKRNINRLFNIFKLSNLKESITYLTDTKQIPFNNNFIISAFNLAFCGAFEKNDIKLNKNFYVWPDGYYFNKISNLNVEKLQAENFLQT